MEHCVARGTTIAGVITNTGVILAGDRRLTSGYQINDTDTTKIRKLTNNFHCCFSGTAADAVFCIEKASAALLKGNSDREPKFKEVVSELLSPMKGFEYKHKANLSAYIILGGYDTINGKISYHLCEIFSDDDPNLLRKSRVVKKLHYAAMGSGGRYASQALSTYHANSSLLNGMNAVVGAVTEGILRDCHSGGDIDVCTLIPTLGATYSCHCRNSPMYDGLDNPILTEAYTLFQKVYSQILDKKKMEDLCTNGVAWNIGFNMVNDLHVGGFDSRGFIHKFSYITDESARAGLLLLCNKGHCFGYPNVDVDTLQDWFRKSESFTGSELHRYICEGLGAYLDMNSSRKMIDFQSILNNLDGNKRELFSLTPTQHSSYLKAGQTADIQWEDTKGANIPWEL